MQNLEPFFITMVEEIKTSILKNPPSESFEYFACNDKSNELCIIVKNECIIELFSKLKRKYGFNFLMDICGVDWPERNKRFDVVYHLYDPANNRRLRVKVPVAVDEEIISLSSLWKGADWFEREAFDMFGIKFKEHPNLRRILCHEEFVGYPLRKDYRADDIQKMSGDPIEHTYERDRERLMQKYNEDLMWINIGPAHPATHGTLRFMAVIDGGEVIKECDTEIGYLHRCFEKMCETHNYNQIIPYTDRLNYCSSPINNNAFALTVEKLLGIEVSSRVKVIRMILDELSRIIDHYVCIAANAFDLGAGTPFAFLFQERENVYNLFEKLCGARLTVSLTRIGGLAYDLPPGWVEECSSVLKSIDTAWNETNKLLTKNRIFIQRTKGSGILSKEMAIEYGYTGPCLRAVGVDMDLRQNAPYYLYDKVDFDIPIALNGDTYDRYLVRMEEVQQSMRIIRWCLDNLPEGSIKVDNKLVSLPDKKDVYGNIEGLMNHFMLIINGVNVPSGEVYQAVEGANGELGFYIISNGTGTPYRVKCRPPCFALLSGFAEMVKGTRIADAVAALGSINVIAGELDR